ncbi:unnamed protein product, partial [Effrenium voratum]
AACGREAGPWMVGNLRASRALMFLAALANAAFCAAVRRKPRWRQSSSCCQSVSSLRPGAAGRALRRARST